LTSFAAGIVVKVSTGVNADQPSRWAALKSAKGSGVAVMVSSNSNEQRQILAKVRMLGCRL
jgi:hypothetical protein